MLSTSLRLVSELQLKISSLSQILAHQIFGFTIIAAGQFLAGEIPHSRALIAPHTRKMEQHLILPTDQEEFPDFRDKMLLL